MLPEQAERVADSCANVRAGSRNRATWTVDVWRDLCGGVFEAQDLFVEVASLLQFEEKAREFIEVPAVEKVAEVLAGGASELKAGEVLGDYKILSLIGEGGMGEVYLAEDTKLGRQIAIKLIKQGFGTASFLRRFQNEEKILAGLNHPNIARLYGASVTAAGIPYFMMEYVDGPRLDHYCRDNKLSVLDRLALFRKVCAAIAYAHQNLVIHRDIKPANIRVTGDGEPKLLDFGIAKLLDSETAALSEQTMTLVGVMTPDYASPEQVRGENMTTASDVYSLGVVLYELLTEQKPYEIDQDTHKRSARDHRTGTNATEHGRRKRRWKFHAPKAPSSKLLRGDLDNIVMMAMRKETTRRYGSVGQFSDDIRRYLEGRPVIARKDTFSYRTVKFIKRNKVIVAAAGLVVLSLIGGIFATTLQARRANLQRTRAEQRFNDVRRLAHSLMFEIDDSVKDLTRFDANAEAYCQSSAGISG